MTLQEVEAITTGGESVSLEFKKSTGQRTEAARTTCAMLNGPGGYIFFGIRNDGTVTGQDIGESTLRQLTAELRKIEPQIVIQPEVLWLENGEGIIILSVPAEPNRTFCYDGRPYVRNGPETVRMEQEEYRRRLLRERNLSERWEVQPAMGFDLTDLDEAEIVRTVDEAVRRGRMDDPGTRDSNDLLLGLGLLRDRQITNAAVILFGRSERLLPTFPQSFLRMARFQGATTDVFVDNRQEHGHVFDLYQSKSATLLSRSPPSSRPHPTGRIRERGRAPLSAGGPP